MRKVVCVTGASGFIGSWLVKRLLLRGYTVNATVIDLGDPKHTDHLLALDGAKERLHLFQANLLDDGSFDSAVDGSQGVFHLASPVIANPKDPQAEILEPAVKGTLNVLGSCAKFQSVKRVVLTSSMIAVLHSDRQLSPEVVVDESWFSDPEVLEKSEGWYRLSKTLAEEAAWKFVKEKGIDMVVMNPSVVIGPLLQPTLNVTNSMILNLINGAKTYANATVGWIHVRDVVYAHIQALEIPSASGRYCLSERVAHSSDIVELLRQLYPTLQLPVKCMDDKPFMPKYQISKEKAKGLGIVDYTPLEVTLKETVESLKEKKFVSF
ncbi:hypothetical protein Ancab_000147 [Ancistrocladus abbreviatus]